MIRLPERVEIDEKELTTQLLTKFQVDRDFRVQYEADVIRSYKQYLAHTDEVNRTGSTAGGVDNAKAREFMPKRSNLFIPKTTQQVDTFRARALKALAGSNPYYDFIPKAAKDTDMEMIMDHEERAKLPASLVNGQLDRNNFVSVIWDFLTSMAIAKAGILSIGWRYEERTVKKRRDFFRKVGDNLANALTGKFKNITWTDIVEEKEVVWDDNEVVNVDWFDCWPDARGKTYDPETWRHCWIRDWMTRSQIEQHREMIKKAGGTVFDITDMEWDQLVNKNADLEEGRQQRLNAVGKSQASEDSATVTNKIREMDKDNILYEVLKYYNGEDYGMVISRYKMSHYTETPYWRHKKIPVVFQPYDPLPNEVQGRSFCDMLFHLNEEKNTQRNQRIDNRALNINTQWMTDDDEMPDRILGRPGNVIKRTQGTNFAPVPILDMTGSSVQEEAIIDRDIEDIGYSAIALGVDASQQQTYGEAQIKNTNASSKIDAKLNLYQSTSMRRLIYLMDMNNQQFMTDKRLIHIADEEGIKKWREIGPDDIGGEWDYLPASANVDPYANKEVRRQQLMMAAEIAQKAGFKWDMEVIGDDILKTFDVRNPTKYKMSDEKIAELEQQNMQAQQMQMQMAAAQEQAQNQAKMQEKLLDILGDLVLKAVEVNPALINEIAGMAGINPGSLSLQNMQPGQGEGVNQNAGQEASDPGYGVNQGIQLPKGIG